MEKTNIEIIANKFEMLKPSLNERQRRLWAAAEAMALGRGGITIVASATGMSRNTIAIGVKELESGERLEKNQVRRGGGGRKKLTQTHPGLLEALDKLVEPSAKGDPMSPLRWTTKSAAKLCAALKEQGFTISERKTIYLLGQLGYTLAANRKSIEGGNDPDRNAQFELINQQAERFMAMGCPVLSLDAKKKELIGNYKQNGQVWRPKGEPEQVQVYDFPDKELGKATPYGIYDVQHNIGMVNVGIDHDTAEFAVESLRRWYDKLGRTLYPESRHIYITADGGGSNGSRNRLWKYCLQQFADESGLTIHVSHFPPGTSKWNKIEHRLFNHISMNWKGQPLVSLELIISLIGATTSRTGLKVYAIEDSSKYEIHRKITDEEMAALNLVKSEKLDKWNYEIRPREKD